MSELDTRAFRNALGRFATGIVVVTTATTDSVPVGVTINSFTSLSLEPPLVLFCLKRAARALEVFATAPGFAVHVLSARQQALSARFAGAHDQGEPWARLHAETGTSWDWSAAGTPQLADCLARFECQRAPFLDGGDHVILVGQVTGFTVDPAADTAPLLYYQGRYAGLAHPAPVPA